MSAAGLRIARGFTLDPDYVGGRTFALVAKKGAGKSYTARVMAEEFWQAKIPFVLLDPMGTSWGLRSSADGEGEGIPVAIFGGEHGDAPLERGGGELMADLVVDEGLSMVLDMSDLGTRAAERQFAQDFLERVYRRNRDLVHLLLDEADLFAPQKPQHGDRQLLGITENIVRRGRNRGVGITLITQRPAVLNKDVLTQVDGLVAMQITGLTDRKAINEWVKGHSVPEEAERVMPTLAELDPGECWWWIPQLGILKQVKVRTSRTFDSSPTQTRSGRKAEPKSFADVDMGAIEERMASTIERAKADDPKELRKQLAAERKRAAQLERDLAKRPTETKEVEVEKVVEVPVLANGVVEQLQASVRGMLEAAEGIKGELAKVTDPHRARSAQVRRAPQRTPARSLPAQAKGQVRGSDSPRSREEPKSEPAPLDGEDGDVELGPGARKMLNVLAQRHPMRLSISQLCTLAGYRPPRRSSTTRGALSQLRKAGLVEEAGREIWFSEAGLDAIDDVPPPPAPDELLEHWRSVLSPAARDFLDVLVEAYPDWMDREDLCDAAGRELPGQSSTTRGGLADLRRNGLVEEAEGSLKASDELFNQVPA